jgi:hypothetical protein
VPGRIASCLLETSQRSLGHVSFEDDEPVSLFGAEQVNPAPVSPSLLSHPSRPVVPVRVMPRVGGRRLTYRFDDDDDRQLFEEAGGGSHNRQQLDDGDGGRQELGAGDDGINSQQLDDAGGVGSPELGAGGSQQLNVGGVGSQQLGTGDRGSGTINALFSGMNRQI